MIEIYGFYYEKMVFTNKYTQILIDKFKNFANSKSLSETIELFCDEDDRENINICTIFTGLTNYVTDELIKKNIQITEEEIKIYEFVEEMLERFIGFPEETDEFGFYSAACTCFLENLLNTASWENIKYDRFIPYLGKRSKEYCKAWDEFTGVRSPGLWTDVEWASVQKRKQKQS